MEYTTYTIFAFFTTSMGYFDNHSGGIVAISSVVTALISAYFKKKASNYYKKNDRQKNERLDKK